MNTLFPIEPLYPAGFQYHPHFISPEEEEQLVNEIKNIELHTFLFQGYEAKRKVASFGYDWSFEKRKLSKGKEIPPMFHWLISKAAKKFQIPFENITELLITEYPPGAVINWHRDAPPFDIIIGISLLSDCVFKLRPYEKAKQVKRRIISIPLQRRSIYIIKDSARTDWEHSIAPVQQTRYSITLRTVKPL